MSETGIKVYGTAWCPDCVRAKKVMDRHAIAYSWIDIADSAEARAYVEKINNGNRSVPTIVFPDGTVLVEPSNAELEKKLASLK
jgi:glutaredoxin-like protein